MHCTLRNGTFWWGETKKRLTSCRTRDEVTKDISRWGIRREAADKKKPPPKQGLEFDTDLFLELKHGRQLNAARATAADERVADAHVARGSDGQTAAANFTIPGAVERKASRGRIGDKRRQQRIREVRVIEQVEEVDSELHADALGNRRLLVDGEVPLFERRSSQRVAAHVAEVPRSDYAIRGCT